MKRWQLALAVSATGACLALGLGAGVAAAEPGTAGGESSHSAGAQAAPARSAPARERRAAKRQAARDASPAPLTAKRSNAHRPVPEKASDTGTRGPGSADTPKPLPRSLSRTTAAPEPGASSAAVRPSPVTVPSVNVDDYLGTWYEVGSVKQFFSVGLVNTRAVYSQNADGSIEVENSGNYFFNKGLRSRIVGSALPVDATNAKLNVKFFGPPSAKAPGNYWIVGLDPGYQTAIVSDPTGRTGFLLSRTPIVSEEQYQELLAEAKAAGVKGRITPTRQPAAHEPAGR